MKKKRKARLKGNVTQLIFTIKSEGNGLLRKYFLSFTYLLFHQLCLARTTIHEIIVRFGPIRCYGDAIVFSKLNRSYEDDS